MNRTLKLALGAVLGLGLVMPATAQNFPDIPDNHWAYEAIANLKGKVLFGYPDGLYRPARPMSRAEFAAAVNQLYQMMMAKDNQLQSAIDALAQRVSTLEGRPGGGGDVSRQEFDALKRQVDELTNRVNGMQSWGQDINNLKRLAAEFERELAEQGVNIDAMKRDMADMAARLSRLEGMGSGLGIDIGGDINFVGIMGHSTDQLFGLSKTGRLLGVGRDDYFGVPVGMTGDSSVFHEMNTTLSGTAGQGVTWKASLNFGNMLGWWDDIAFGDLNSQNAGFNIESDNDSSMWFDELNASFDSSIAGQGFNAHVGRIRVQSGPFFYERPDYTEFFKNDRWDDGGYIMDGAKIGFGLGTVDLTVWGGLTGEGLEAVSGEAFELNNQFLDLGGDSFAVEKQLGVELALKLGDKGHLKGVYLWQDSDNLDSGMNRMNVYGGEVKFDLGSIDLYAVYSQTDFGYNTDVMLDSDNTAWAAWGAFDGGNWGVDGGYARVEGNFGAFGNWGRLGTIYNPRNVEGFGAGIWINAGDRLKLSAGGAFFDGADDAPGLFGVPLTTDDSVTSFNVKLNYEINAAWGLMLGYENVDWKFDADTDPNLRWYTVGLNWAMNESSKVSIMYMMSDADFKGNLAGIDPGAGGPFGAQDRYKGGVLSSQVTFRF